MSTFLPIGGCGFPCAIPWSHRHEGNMVLATSSPVVLATPPAAAPAGSTGEAPPGLSCACSPGWVCGWHATRQGQDELRAVAESTQPAADHGGEVLWEGDTDEGYLRVREGVQRRMCDGVWRRAYEPEAHECAFVLARQHRELVAALKELLAAGRDYLAEPKDDPRVSVVRRYNAARAEVERLRDVEHDWTEDADRYDEILRRISVIHDRLSEQCGSRIYKGSTDYGCLLGSHDDADVAEVVERVVMRRIAALEADLAAERAARARERAAAVALLSEADSLMPTSPQSREWHTRALAFAARAAADLLAEGGGGGGLGGRAAATNS